MPHKRGKYVLLGGLPQVLLSLVQLFLEQLHLARQVLARSPVCIAFFGGRLEVLDFAFELVDRAFGKGQLVLEGSDLLVSLKKGLVELSMLAILLLLQLVTVTKAIPGDT